MFIEEQFILLSIGLATIALRVFIRWRQVGISGWQLDDYLMPLTGVVFTLETVAAYLVGAEFQGLTNSYMTDEQRAELDPESEEYFNRQWGSKVQVIGWSFYVFILWAIKFCFASYYSRLTSGLTHLKLRVRIAYVLLAVTYLAVALTLLLSCQPMRKFWQINPDPGALCRPTNSPVYVLVVVIPNVLTDLYLLSIPLPLLWRVKISLRRRLTLMFLFSGAIFVIMAGTIRAVVISKSGPEGAVSGSSWACRETFVAIIVANVPIIQPLLRKAANKSGVGNLFRRYLPSSSNGSNNKHDRISETKGKTDTKTITKSKLLSWKRTHHRQSHSIPTLTGRTSDEYTASVEKADGLKIPREKISNVAIATTTATGSGRGGIGGNGSDGITVEEKISIQSTSACPDNDDDCISARGGGGGGRVCGGGKRVGVGVTGGREFDWGFQTSVRAE